MTRLTETRTLTGAELLLVLLARGEVRCDVFALPNGVFASTDAHWISLDTLEGLVREGLITVRLEEVPHALMGPRTPPIRHCSLTEAGRLVAKETGCAKDSTPLYIPKLFKISDEDLAAVPWMDQVAARRECFMSSVPREYTYGSGIGVRTYRSVGMLPWVASIMERVPGDPNVCFLNRYDGERNALGWHSDDSPDTSGDHPITVVSTGESREIWRRRIGESGEVPPEDRQVLEPGSMFVMPAGFQSTHEHRIPKGSRSMGPRVSLTFRRMVDRRVCVDCDNTMPENEAHKEECGLVVCDGCHEVHWDSCDECMGEATDV